MSDNQASIFLIYISTGILICMFYDIFRALRKAFKTKNIFIYLEDLIFWTVVGTVLIIEILHFNSGELRFYIFLGIVIGCLIYLLTISKFILKILTNIFKTIKKIIWIIINPIIHFYKLIVSLFTKIIKKIEYKKQKIKKFKIK